MSYLLSIESKAILLSSAKQLREVAEKEHKRAREQGLDIERLKTGDFFSMDGRDETHAVVQLLDYLHDTAGELETITKELS